MSGNVRISPRQRRGAWRTHAPFRTVLRAKGELPPGLAVVVAAGITATVTWVVVLVASAVGPT
jgi:hypothetical protein